MSRIERNSTATASPEVQARRRAEREERQRARRDELLRARRAECQREELRLEAARARTRAIAQELTARPTGVPRERVDRRRGAQALRPVVGVPLRPGSTRVPRGSRDPMAHEHARSILEHLTMLDELDGRADPALLASIHDDAAQLRDALDLRREGVVGGLVARLEQRISVAVESADRHDADMARAERIVAELVAAGQLLATEARQIDWWPEELSSYECVLAELRESVEARELECARRLVPVAAERYAEASVAIDDRVARETDRAATVTRLIEALHAQGYDLERAPLRNSDDAVVLDARHADGSDLTIEVALSHGADAAGLGIEAYRREIAEIDGQPEPLACDELDDRLMTLKAELGRDADFVFSDFHRADGTQRDGSYVRHNPKPARKESAR